MSKEKKSHTHTNLVCSPMTSVTQTVRFDTSLCKTDELQKSYEKVCNGSDKCVTNMKKFCMNEIQTNQEFNLQANLLNCTIQCGDDKTCRQRCSSTITH